LELRMPPGYHARPDPDVLFLLRADGSVVALFSVGGFVADEVERAAWEDYGEAAGDPYPSRVPTERLRPPPPRARPVPWPPRPPG
jgi:hypothetical protein